MNIQKNKSIITSILFGGLLLSAIPAQAGFFDWIGNNVFNYFKSQAQPNIDAAVNEQGRQFKDYVKSVDPVSLGMLSIGLGATAYFFLQGYQKYLNGNSGVNLGSGTNLFVLGLGIASLAGFGGYLNSKMNEGEREIRNRFGQNKETKFDRMTTNARGAWDKIKDLGKDLFGDNEDENQQADANNANNNNNAQNTQQTNANANSPANNNANANGTFYTGLNGQNHAQPAPTAQAQTQQKKEKFTWTGLVKSIFGFGEKKQSGLNQQQQTIVNGVAQAHTKQQQENADRELAQQLQEHEAEPLALKAANERLQRKMKTRVINLKN